MSGTYTGGIKSAEKLTKEDPLFYVKLGRLGGKAKNPNKGFGSNRELARIMGAKGGKKSRR